MAGRIGFIRLAVDNLSPSFKLTDQLSDECDIGRLDCCAIAHRPPETHLKKKSRFSPNLFPGLDLFRRNTSTAERLTRSNVGIE